MSVPLAAIFQGDVTIEAGSNTTSFGFGDLTVVRKGFFNGTEDSTGLSTGNIINQGGLVNVKAVRFDSTMDVNGHSTLDQVSIDTSDGQTSITGSNAVSISVGAASNFTSTGGNVTLSSTTESAIVSGGATTSDAVQITASNGAGGIQVLSGTSTGLVNIGTGSGGFTVGATAGSVNTTSYGASSTFAVASTGAGQDLNISVSGATDSSINMTSSGTGTDAIGITATAAAGGIQLLSGTTTGLVNIGTGSGGFTVGATAGSVNTTSYGASSTFAVASTGAGQDLNISVSGATDSSINMTSSGTGTDAIGITATAAAGGIQLLSGTTTGLVNIGTGSGGFTVGTTAGSVNTTSYGASSTFTVASTGAGQDLNLSVSGATDSSVNITSSGTGTDAIRLETTSGGIYMFAEGRVDIQSTDNVNGINIGTINSGLVNIGKAGSTTTIYGDLNVLGPVTAIESTVLTVEDNVIFLNNGPSVTSDGGVAIKRWQSANDTALGEVVNPPSNPPGYESATAQAGSATTITLAAGANAVDDFYNGWWLEITAGTGASQVRKIKDYNGTTKVASIYTTADQTGVLGSPTPVEGLDFSTAPANDSVYALYPSTYTMMIWDESSEEFAFVYATLDDEQQVTFNGNYADLHIRNLTVDTITATTINNASADLIFNVTLVDNLTSAVTMAGFALTYGVYVVLVRPDTAVTNRPFAIFVIGRIDDNAESGTVTRLISIRGAGNSQLSIQWASGGVKPGLFFSKEPTGGGSTIFKVRALTI